METISTVRAMQDRVTALRQSGKTIGFVPTMGALHEGHLTLVDAAKRRCDVVAMSIFVNPTQFGPKEDFARYPRDLQKDAAMAAARGVDLLFAPGVEEMYPEGAQTFVEVTELTKGLCNLSRPGHFRGVATVVAKLFLIAQPHCAFFGEKDYQQLQVVKTMARDLRFPLEVIGVPTVREPDGLAMSSRNAYLSPQARTEALQLYRGMQAASAALAGGEREVSALRDQVLQVLKKVAAIQVEYVEIVDAASLEPLAQVERPARLMLAVHLNGTRLIDNIALNP